jgi:FkbM family methyltransferase
MATALQKIRSGARILLSAEVWGIALVEARRAKGPVPPPPPSPVVVDEDAAAGMRAVEIGGHRYWLPLDMDWAGMSMLYSEVFCEAHPHHYEYGGCRVRPGDVVVDAGSAEGFFARFALDRGARVLIVEPWGPMAEALRRTYEAEIAEGCVRVEPAALAAEGGEGLLQLDPRQPWGASLASGPARGDVSAVVRRTTLDALVAASPWGRCDFLKMDVEGAERDALRGARETLRRDRPRLSVAVYHHPTGYLDIRRDLRSLGLGYRVAGKGVQRRRGLYIPMMLHAWHPEGDAGDAGGSSMTV